MVLRLITISEKGYFVTEKTVVEVIKTPSEAHLVGLIVADEHPISRSNKELVATSTNIGA